MYCIEARYDEKAREWRIDEKATGKLREAKRRERLARGTPVEKWWQQARARIVEKRLDPLLIEMYRSSMKLSEGFTREYKDFWGLPGDFTF